MRLHFPRIGLFQLGMKKKKKKLISTNALISHGSPVYRNEKSRPPFHPEDEPIITKRTTTGPTLLSVCPQSLELLTTACVQVQLEGNYNWIIFMLFVHVFFFVPAVKKCQQQPRYCVLSVSSGILNGWYNICILTRIDLKIKHSWIIHLVRHTRITGVISAAAVSPLHEAILTDANMAKSSNKLSLLLHFTVVVRADFKMHTAWQLGTP